MQPYFLPYIGYWQLIQAADVFVLGDDFQYMQRGWINRNRFLRQDGGWFYLTLPVQKHDVRAHINSVFLHPDADLSALLMGALLQYRYRQRAPFFDDVYGMIMDTAKQLEARAISAINEVFIRAICAYLQIRTEIRVMSASGFDFREQESAEARMVRFSQDFQASEFLIPVGGQALYRAEAFEAQGRELQILRSHDIRYPQRGGFEPSLSIVDVLMFNGQQETRKLLEACTIARAEAPCQT